MGQQAYPFKKKAPTGSTGSSGWIRLGAGFIALQVAEDCDSASAGVSPTCDLVIETNAVGSDGGKRAVGGIASFAQVTGSGGGRQRRRITDLDAFVKVSWIIGGTGGPVFNLGVSGVIERLGD